MDVGAEIALNSLPVHGALRHTYYVPPNSVDVNRVLPEASYEFRVSMCGATYVFRRESFPTGTLLKIRTCTQSPWVGPIP